MSDLITRQAVIDMVKDWNLNQRIKDEEDALDDVNALPSAQPEVIACGEGELTAQPERKTGKWIIRDNPGTGWYRITCSKCGEDVTATAPCIGFFPNAKVNWDYCPNCGSYNSGEDGGGA